ncbi:MAG TPA: SRPBCC domain-containing protein [Kofleriaceae bacterium]|nr:SRPBCC domain-containing protein [Kofleriaceae bacterium]
MKPNSLIFTIATEIDASPETVWRVLTDLPRYPEWNPFIRNACGSLAVGGTVRVRVRPMIQIPLVFHARILRREDNRALVWRGSVGGEWLAAGEHSFLIEPIDDGRVRFVQHEELVGLVPRFTAKLLAREVEHGFAAMNRELAARCQRIEQAERATLAGSPAPHATA